MRVWERCPLPWQLGGRMGRGEGYMPVVLLDLPLCVFVCVILYFCVCLYSM